MAKYLLLKHYRGAPKPINDVPMEHWTPEEISAHMQYMRDFASRLEGTGEFVDSHRILAQRVGDTQRRSRPDRRGARGTEGQLPKAHGGLRGRGGCGGHQRSPSRWRGFGASGDSIRAAARHLRAQDYPLRVVRNSTVISRPPSADALGRSSAP